MSRGPSIGRLPLRTAASGGLALLAALAACGDSGPTGPGPDVELVEVLETFPHDQQAFTQGLLLHGGVLYESTGRFGRSDLRRVELETGAVLASTPLPDARFGEGLARVGDELVQLTWRSGDVFVYDLATLALKRILSVDTDGWGLCHDGTSLWMTDGSSLLYRRDPGTLALLETRQIVRDGSPLPEVNELACVGGHIYANVWRTSIVVKIEKASGEVVAEFDATELVPPGFEGDDEAVMNGLAWDPATDTFLLTGKLWPVLYRVRLNEP